MKVMLEGKILPARKFCSSNIGEKISLDFLAKAGAPAKELNSSSVWCKRIAAISSVGIGNAACLSCHLSAFRLQQLLILSSPGVSVVIWFKFPGISRSCSSGEPLQLSANQPKGTPTSQHSPPSPALHKDEVGLISLLGNFLLKLPFESAY